MHNHISGIDHSLIAVRDLDSAAATWRRLGFITTPRGRHPEWGTANHCVMFAREYLELISPVGPGQRADLLRAHLADRGEGLSAIAFGADDAEAAGRALRAAGLAVGEPTALTRPLGEEPGAARLRFAILPLPDSATPGASSFLCQHFTPTLLRRDEWLRHPNGARRINALTVVVDDALESALAYETVFGAGSAIATDNTVAVHTGNGLVLLTRPEDLTQLHPEADLDPPPEAPAIVAATLAVSDADAAARWLDDQGVPFSRDNEGTIRISPADANGVFLELTQA
ncbi:MAG: VOC family protein [Rhodospirillales bacterium]|nr:VOC family protein [Rhodospirillales bacterium]